MSRLVVPHAIAAIARARRAPAHCLYCDRTADSREHVLAAALGGRLVAPILCQEHNGAVAVAADEPMAVELAPLVTMLGVVRPHRKISSFVAHTDAGDRVVIDAAGDVRRKKLDGLEVTSSGKVRYARGQLSKLEEMKADGLLENPDLNILALIEKPPIVNFTITVAADVERGVLKAALHFLSGFVVDVDGDVARDILPYILGSERAGGHFVRSMPLAGRFFPESWPPRHEIRTYPDGDETFVTVLLFGLFGFQVRLPIVTPAGLRYSQPLLSPFTPLLEENDHVRTFGWDDRLDEESLPELEANVLWRRNLIVGYSRWRERVAQCLAAAKRASMMMYTYHLSFLEAYEAELRQEAFSSDDVARLVAFARAAITAGRPVWDLPGEDYIVR